jgi:hypothetical protein
VIDSNDKTVRIPVKGWWDRNGITRQKRIEEWLREQKFACRIEGSIVSRRIVFDDLGDAAQTKLKWN